MHKKEFYFADQKVCIETGRIARQATASALVTMGDNVVLATLVAAKKGGNDFFPLSVHYFEKNYAVGKIPGGFFKREGRPSEKEILTCRLIDRPIRPLFPKGFTNEVQIVCTVMSADKNQNPDIAAMIAAFTVVSLAGVPFNGPLGAARIGYTEKGGFVINPDYQQLKHSSLNMVMSGTKDAVLMVESEAKQLTEEKMLEAVLFGHQQIQSVIDNISELARVAAKPAWDWQAPEVDPVLSKAIEDKYAQRLTQAYQLTEKARRCEQLAALRHEIQNEFVKHAPVNQTAESSETGFSVQHVQDVLAKLEKTIVRQAILVNKLRIDGRDCVTVRPINIDVSLLPKAHGSVLFTRGETQAMVIATLASLGDAQVIDSIAGEFKDNFMLHYNFPPYSVGEAGMVGAPKRREIGHGYLAKRAIAAVLPGEEAFPYTLRVVSEITESNGSSSMATVCGASLALMDAGVPLEAPVAGVAMGLIKEDNQFAVLTDILGDEDHLGDMDFKVAGTANGVTALQMDIKIAGITKEIMEQALHQAREGRLHILAEMAKVLPASREEVSENAPSMLSIKINTDKIRDVIGKGGSVIRSIIEDTGAQIDVKDDGTVHIYAEDKQSANKALRRIKELTAEPEVGKIYSGVVKKIMDFGAFVCFMPGKEGLVHISQIAHERINKVSDHLKEEQEISVKLVGVDDRGKFKLSMKETLSS